MSKGVADDNIDIVWEAPPERRRRTMYDDVLPQLKKQQGRWARLRVLKVKAAHGARQNFITITNGDPRWEAVVRPVEGDSDGNYGLWVRYRTDEQMRAASQ